MESPLLKEYRTDPYARAAVDLIRKYKPEIVLFGATTQGRDFAGNGGHHSGDGIDRGLHGPGHRSGNEISPTDPAGLRRKHHGDDSRLSQLSASDVNRAAQGLPHAREG